MPDSLAVPRPRGAPLPGRWSPSALAVLAFALALGAWLRLDQFGAQLLLDDEWHTVHQLVRATPAQFLLSHGRDDHSIALTAWSWLLMQTVGLSEAGMRAPSLAAGLAALLLLPLALAGHADRRVFAVFALLLAISPLLVGYSRMARPYALTLVLTVGAVAVLARAVAGPRVRWGLVAVCALLAALAAWLHAVVAPFVAAPLVALTVQSARGRGLPLRVAFGIAAVVGTAIAAALLPPLLHDAGALAAKAGRDLPRGSTLVGVWHVWLGTSSPWLVIACLALAAVGWPTVWRSGPVVRWAVLGLALTLAAVLVVRPAWVFNPLTFGRYLLPALPLLLVAVAAGVVRVADAVPRARATPLPFAVAAVLAAAAVFTSPTPELLRYPNGHTLHYLYQFDYRPAHNPVVDSFDAIAPAPFWHTLADRPPGSVTVAVAPFRFESPAWLGAQWERTSRQRVWPAFLSGGCLRWAFGEVPLDARFAWRNGVHLADAPALAARGVDYVAFDRTGLVLDERGVRRPAPECEAWMRERFGRPVFDGPTLVVWRVAPAGR